MANINANELQNLVVMQPPSALQKEFGGVVAEVLARERVQEQALHQHEALFASLQQRAFSGAL